MTKLNISAEGDEAADVLTSVLQNLSGTFEAESYTGEVRFGDFSLTASGETPEVVAKQLSLIDYQEDPDALSASFNNVVVDGAEGELEVIETSDEVDTEEAAGNTETYQQIKRPNTMEQTILYSLLQSYSTTAVSPSRAEDVDTSEYVDPTDIAEAITEGYEATRSQVTNALFRLWKRGLTDRKKVGREFHYRLNTNGAAELVRLGEPDYEQTPLVSEGN